MIIETLSTLREDNQFPFSIKAIIPICGRPPVGSLPSNWQASLPTGLNTVTSLDHTIDCATTLQVCLIQFPDISSLSGKAKHVKALHRLPGSRFKAVMMDWLAAGEDKQADDRTGWPERDQLVKTA